MSPKKTKSYQEYMEHTLIPGICKMQSERLAFLSFGILGISIEVLGSFFDERPLDEQGFSKQRFKRAVDRLLRPQNPTYANTCLCKKNEHNDYCLYRGLRCGMAHIGRPQGKIVFTTRDEARSDQNTHLSRDCRGMLVLVAEDLADDFIAGWRVLKTLSENCETKKKVTDPYLTVYNYENYGSSTDAFRL